MQTDAIAKLTSNASAGVVLAAGDASALNGIDFATLLAAQFQKNGSVALPAVGAGAEVELAPLADDVTQDFKAEVAENLKTDIAPDVKPGADADPSLQAVALMQSFAPVVQATQQALPETPEIKATPSAPSPDNAPLERKVSAPPAPVESGMMPDFAPVMQAMQQTFPEIKASSGALLVDKSQAERKVSTTPPLSDSGAVSAKDSASLLARDGVAEFAVGGKNLPSGDIKIPDAKVTDAKVTDLKVAADAFKLSPPPVDAQRTHDAAPSVVPALMGVNQPSATVEIKAPVGVVQLPVGASGWSDAVGQKVVWMAGQHQQVAELHLNPPQLGPMEVRLTINNDQVSALFVSHQPAVREALEAAIPRLREMFAESGMMLGNAMVSSDSLPQQQNSGQERRSEAGARVEFPLREDYSIPVTSRGIIPLNGDGRGMVDLFV